MKKQELRQWILEFAKAPAYPEVIEAIDARIESYAAAVKAEKVTPSIIKQIEGLKTDSQHSINQAAYNRAIEDVLNVIKILSPTPYQPKQEDKP